MPETEQYQPTEEKFAQQIKDRSATWQEMISESSLSNEDKEKAEQIVREFSQKKFDENNSVIDSFYYLVSQLLSVFEKYKDAEAQAIFANLKDDIWELQREINN